MFDRTAGLKNVIGLSLATKTDFNPQEIVFSHLTVITAGDVFMYKDLETDFIDITQTEPLCVSKGSIEPQRISVVPP